MNISVGHIDALQPTTPLLAFGAWESAPLPKAQASLSETDDWAGSFKQTLLLDPRGALPATDRLAPGDIAQAIARAVMLARHLTNAGNAILEYGAAQPGAPSICLVGKAIMSDTGGSSIQPADKLDEMKTDMSSAGDLLKILSELMIEVINTGAEGRIVLADALFYAQRFAPAALSHVVGSYLWVDMDIAGTVWADTRTRAHIPKGATGVGVRLLTQRLQTWAEAHR